MTQALFVTTQTNDTDSLVTAWDCWNETPAARVTFCHTGQPNDAEILAAAKECQPGVIFYVGGHAGRGLPSHETFKALRTIAPSINLCCDAADDPWHSVLDAYKADGCFDLQVALDGRAGAPVDLITITPVDPRPYDGPAPERDIRCGFSGGLGLRGPRGLILNPLISTSQVTVRAREKLNGYFEHANFLRRCRIVINTSFSGSGRTHHIKGRVLEAGMAGAALFETAASPIGDWFPLESYFTYADENDAPRALAAISQEDADTRAAIFSAIVRDKYHPRRIYGAMLEMAGIS